jgi:hypothetical protein
MTQKKRRKNSSLRRNVVKGTISALCYKCEIRVQAKLVPNEDGCGCGRFYACSKCGSPINPVSEPK